MRALEGFVHERTAHASLIASSDSIAAIRQAGLSTPEGWMRILREGEDGSGRGRTSRSILPDGRRIVVKQLRRGGAIGRLWRDRFLGEARALANVEIPIGAAARGVPTASPVALLSWEGPKGLYRAWLATDEILGAEDLTTLYGRCSLDAAALTVAMLDAVRGAHDAGLVHADLNLGNVLARERAAGVWDVSLIDLDRARLLAEPLGFRPRLRALRRLERSAVKRFGPQGPPGAGGTASWYALYARGDGALAARLARSRSAGRFWLALHRMGWKESSRVSPAQRREPR